LSSYFYGYILTQVLSAWLSLRFGAKKVLSASMFLGSVMTILCPESARLGYGVLIVCRFLAGLAHVKLVCLKNK
jgi:MFS family permease